MFEYLKKTFNKIQTYQIAIFIIFNLLVLGALSFTVLFHGLSKVKAFLSKNLIYLFFWYSIPLALLPSYKKVDDKLSKAFKQLGWSGTVLMLSSVTVLFYTSFGADPSGSFAQFTDEFSSFFLSATLFFVLGFFARAGLGDKQ